jgi:hypothetical protein
VDGHLGWGWGGTRLKRWRWKRAVSGCLQVA